MTHRRSIVALFLFISLALVGCGVPWGIVHQASPDPFINAKKFSVLAIDFTGLTVGDKPEVAYLAEKDAEQRASFVADKVAMNAEFTRALVEKAREEGIEVVLAMGPSDAPFLIRPYVAFIEPGWYGGVVGAPSRVRMLVRITTPDGTVLDEIALAHATGASMIAAASGQRLRSDGEGLGRYVARYLKSRTAPTE